MTKTRQAPRTQKVRPEVVGGKHGAGHLRTTRVRRPGPGRIHREASDQALTRVAGLVSFGSCVRRCGLDRKLARTFDEKKPDRRLVYPMSAQIPLGLDSHVADETSAFGIGALAGVDT